jgi:hypothetical protein
VSAPERLATHLDELGTAISFGATMCAAERDGELKFYVRDRCIISGIYVNEREAPLILAQWRQKARGTFVSDTMNAAKIVDMLLDLRTTENTALIEQLQKLNRTLETLESQIKVAERQLDDLAYDLYALTPQERLMVEADTQPRWDARIPTPPV